MPSRLVQRRDWRDAFTLVELLVVIGIISVLVGILLPVLAGARERANSVKCQMNLRGLGQAWQAYAQEWKGAILPGRMPVNVEISSIYGLGHWDAYRPRWYELAGAMVKQFPAPEVYKSQVDSWQITNRWFLCPARPEWTNSRNYVFGYNYQFLGNARAFGVARQRGNKSKDYIRYPVMANKIKADRTVMAADSMGTAAGKAKSKRTGYLFDGSKDEYAWCNKGWCLDPPRLTPTSDYADPQHRSPHDRSGPDPRHNGKVNVVFCDGHVESMTPQQMGYVVSPIDQSMPASAPGAHNRLFSGTGEDDDPPPAFNK